MTRNKNTGQVIRQRCFIRRRRSGRHRRHDFLHVTETRVITNTTNSSCLDDTTGIRRRRRRLKTKHQMLVRFYSTTQPQTMNIPCSQLRTTIITTRRATIRRDTVLNKLTKLCYRRAVWRSTHRFIRRHTTMSRRAISVEQPCRMPQNPTKNGSIRQD